MERPLATAGTEEFPGLRIALRVDAAYRSPTRRFFSTSCIACRQARRQIIFSFMPGQRLHFPGQPGQLSSDASIQPMGLERMEELSRAARFWIAVEMFGQPLGVWGKTDGKCRD